MMILQCIYTGVGRQRAVFLEPWFEGGRFAVELEEGDEALVEVSFDPESEVRRGRGLWQPFEGGFGGGLEGLTALRVNVRKLDGWVKLTVLGGAHDTGE